MAQQDNEAEVFAKGLAAAAGLGQLGHIEPNLAYTMIDTVSADQAVMERKFPGLGREDLLRAYDDSVRDLVAADVDCRERNPSLSMICYDLIEHHLYEPVCRRQSHIDRIVPVILH